jgi:hypothetical protein
MFATQVGAKSRAPSEVRAADNLPPFTPEQIQEMKDLGILCRHHPPRAERRGDPTG